VAGWLVASGPHPNKITSYGFTLSFFISPFTVILS
jgi:hypothetical protein